MRCLRCVILLALLSQCMEANTLEFVETCNRNQPNLTECVEASAKELLPKLIKGVKELNVPPLIQFKLPKIYSPQSATYNLVFDGVLDNLDGVQYIDSVFDSKHWFAYGKLYFPKLKLQGKYKLDGVVGTEFVKGNGTAEVDLDNIAFEIIWFFKTVKRNGTEYLELVESTLISYELRRAEYNFENLFSGDKARGTEANNYLNRNWSMLEGDFTRYVADVVHKLSFEVGNRLLDAAPLDVLFKE